jgi:Zn-dependent M28 family amino/carboxypeptidase
MRSPVPVLFVSDAKAAKTLKKKRSVKLSAKVEERFLDAVNIVGGIDNGAESTIVIGAHYDHLGMGDEGSLHKGEPAVHNGADDNASGTAGVIELARWVMSHPDRSHNYLFVCFSAEEMGLLGSNYFVKHMKLPAEQINYMINMDMIGRLSEDKGLAISGVGTSPRFMEMVEKKACFDYPVKTSAGGRGPSDHTSFYNQDIPVLHFFTGTHEDYHKPSDDFEKINLEGSLRVLEYIAFWMESLKEYSQIDFTATKDDSSEKAPKFSVTLGVVPDYLYSGEGMRIDGITDGKPAAKAGLKTGDVVLQLGDMRVRDMMSYMKALSVFKAGDRTELIYEREGKEQKTQVEF